MNDFVYTTYIATTPAKLWRALTESDFTVKYWGGCGIQSDWKPGSPWKLVKADGETVVGGAIKESNPPSRMVYTFDPHSSCGIDPKDFKKEAPTTVTYDIEEFKGQVKFTVTHVGFPEGSEVRKSVSNGWPNVIAGLKTLLESGKPLFA